MAEQKPIHWTRASTLIALAVLVGTEFTGAAWAAGWALGGLFDLGATVSHIIEGFFVLLSFWGLYQFMRKALANEPVRG